MSRTRCSEYKYEMYACINILLLLLVQLAFIKGQILKSHTKYIPIKRGSGGRAVVVFKMEAGDALGVLEGVSGGSQKRAIIYFH